MFSRVVAGVVSIVAQAASKGGKVPGSVPSPAGIIDAVMRRRRPISEVFQEAERQVDEVIGILSPGPLVTPLGDEEILEAERAVRAATKRWRDAQSATKKSQR